MGIVKVLWEDASNKGMVKDFGPQRLLEACVADALGVDRFSLKQRLGGYPKKGTGAIEAACRDDLGDLTIRGEHVVAVVDSDKTDVTRLRKKLGNGRLTVMPLDRNVEDLVDAAARCLGLASTDTKLEKDPNIRDAVLNRLAAESRDQREHLLRAMPSFHALVDVVLLKLRGSESRRTVMPTAKPASSGRKRR